jgi:hypothetical protein
LVLRTPSANTPTPSRSLDLGAATGHNAIMPTTPELQIARDKCVQAMELLREAQTIFREFNRDVDSLNISEALEYIAETT